MDMFIEDVQGETSRIGLVIRHRNERVLATPVSRRYTVPVPLPRELWSVSFSVWHVLFHSTFPLNSILHEEGQCGQYIQVHSLGQFQLTLIPQESKSIRQTVSKMMSVIILLYSASATRKVSRDMREILRDDGASISASFSRGRT